MKRGCGERGAIGRLKGIDNGPYVAVLGHVLGKSAIVKEGHAFDTACAIFGD